GGCSAWTSPDASPPRRVSRAGRPFCPRSPAPPSSPARACSCSIRPIPCAPDSSSTREARRMKTLVLGGGVVGVTTAYFLAKAGHEVTLLEEKQGLGIAATTGHAGISAPDHPRSWELPP